MSPHPQHPEPSADAIWSAPERLLDWADGPGGGRLPSPALTAALRRERARILSLPAESLLALLDRVLGGESPGKRLVLLSHIGFLDVLLPEVAALRGFHEDFPVQHKDLWAHTIQVVAQTPATPDLRWAALLHDIGKISTREQQGGRVSFLRHEPAGAWMTRGIGARLQMPPERIDRIAFIIEHHARVNAYRRGWGETAVRRLMRDSGPHLDDILAFSAADITTKRTELMARVRNRLAHLRERVAAIHIADARPRSFPRGFGERVRTTIGAAPGPEVGRAIAWLQGEIDAGALPEQAPPEVYLAALDPWPRPE